MQVPLQITYRHMDPSDVVNELLQQKVAKLEQLYDRIVTCQIVVEAPHDQPARSNQYIVRLHLTLPGEEIAVNRDPPMQWGRRDLYTAIRDAFEAATRQLREHVARHHGHQRAVECERTSH